MTPEEIQEVFAEVDAWLFLFFPRLVTVENAWYGSHGKYWQGKKTHSDVPENGAWTVPNLSATFPTKQGPGSSWDDFPGLLTPTMPCRVEVFQHNGADFTPPEPGYNVLASVMIDEVLWERGINFEGIGDADQDREFPWREAYALRKA